MKPAKEDETELLKAARKRFGDEVTLGYTGYNEMRGHTWVVYKNATQCARGWFDPEGMPHFVLRRTTLDD
jgi:hypothetical protein